MSDETGHDDPARERIGMWLRVARVYNLAMRELRDSLRGDCTMPQFDTLAQLARHDRGLTFRELSELLLVTAGNLTGIVDRLEREKFVKRKTNPKDRRETFIVLTEKGKAFCDEVIPRHEQAIMKLFEGVNDKVVESVRRGMLEVQAALKEREGRPLREEILP